MHDRVQPAGLQRSPVEVCQREALFADAVEQPAMQQLDAGEDVGRDLLLGAPARLAERVEKIVAATLIAGRAGRPLQQQHRIHARILERAGEPGQGVILAVEP